MPRSIRTLRYLVLTLAVAILFSACPSKTPEQLVSENRARYTVRLENFYPQPPAPVVDESALDGEMADGEMADGEMADGEMADGEMADGEIDDIESDQAVMENAAPVTMPVLFDFYVLYEGSDPLPGVTVDFSHADASGTEKGSWRYYLEVPGMAKGEARQKSVTIEVDDYEEGDLFSAQLNEYVDPAEQSEYQEFSAAQ